MQQQLTIQGYDALLGTDEYCWSALQEQQKVAASLAEENLLVTDDFNRQVRLTPMLTVTTVTLACCLHVTEVLIAALTTLHSGLSSRHGK